MNDSIDSEKILKYHGKTFYFAQRFLGRENGYAVARLYRFCRYIDDLADESGNNEEAEKKLHEIRLQLCENHSDDHIVRDFLQLAQEWRINVRYALDLIDGVISDFGKVAIQNRRELLQYCYRVAGTVGLMMCPLLYADEKGERFALDLGIAMQLTNIARDVLYDAQQYRRYLPAEWVEGLSAEKICELNESDRLLIQKSIRRLVDLAEIYYGSAKEGYIYLPLRSRVSIAIAAKTYRQIGIKLLNNDCDFWQGRTYTSLTEKLVLALRELLVTFTKAPRLQQVEHNQKLHDDLVSLYPQNFNGEKFAP